LEAKAWVTNLSSGSKFRTNISDISMGGCHVEYLTGVPYYADIMVNIARDSGNFESRAEVVFNHLHLGMGIRFVETRPSQSAVLYLFVFSTCESKREHFVATVPG